MEIIAQNHQPNRHIQSNEQSKTHHMENKLQKALELCNSQEFERAEGLLQEFLKEDPQNSEAWRVLAQVHWIHMHEPEKAYDELIEALRCNPKNMWALILMGNLLSKEHNDMEHAKDYFDKVLEYYPDNDLAVNNIGGIFLQQEEFEKAIPYFERSISLDETSANYHYGLALCYYKLGKMKEAFDSCHQGLLKSKDKPENPNAREQLTKLFLNVASEYAKTINVINVWTGIKDELEDVDHIPIRFVEDRNLDLYAKMEYALTHGAKEHVIRYNPDKQFVDHMFIHEMMHLKMGQKATKANKGKVVVGTTATKSAFYRRFHKYMKRALRNMPSAELDHLMNKLGESLNYQLMNCPLDLFVEHIIFSNYKQVRPLQLVSLFHTEIDNINTAQKAFKDGYFPPEIARANKVMNLVTSLHFKEMYGIDLIGNYRPTKSELDMAKDLYDEFKAYLRTYRDGDEFEMLEYFVETLRMDDLLELQDEKVYANALTSVSYDIPEENLSDEDIDAENARFALEHQDGADEMETKMMAMYMVGAMEEFDKKTHQEVKAIAFEIATVGMAGINPKGKYSIKSVPGKEFGGYQFLAWYYVSIARVMPEMLGQLGLPYDKAYEMALGIYNSMKGKK